MKFSFLSFLLACLPYGIWAQQIVLTHQPFEYLNKDTSFSYIEDTAIFDSNQAIWGITYVNSDVKNLRKEVLFANAFGLERSATFNFQAINPNQLNWHPVIRAYWQKIFDLQNWYAMKLTPYPSAINATEGVAFLEIIEDIVDKQTLLNSPEPLHYKLVENEAFRTCKIDFKNGHGNFAPLLEKTIAYKKQIKERQQLRNQQLKIEKKFEPQGFQQIASWGIERDGYAQKIKQDDEQLFIAIEKMKVMTEEVADAISTEEKRLLRELFLLDVNMLDANEYERSKLQKRRAELFKRITVYPSLKPLVQQYQKLTNLPKELKADERLQERNLQQISRKFKPYEANWKTHQKLQKRIDELDEDLQRF